MNSISVCSLKLDNVILGNTFFEVLPEKLLLHLFFLKHDYDVRVDEMKIAAIKTWAKVVFCNM